MAEELYGALTSRLGLDKLAPEQRIKGLLTVAAEDLIQFSPELVALGPVIDNDSIPSMASFSNIGHDGGLHLPGKTWCKELFLIESQFDFATKMPCSRSANALRKGSIFALVNLNNRQDGINAAFTKSIRESLGDAAASKLLDAYRISPETSDIDTLEKIISFVTDASFYAPAVKLGQAWPGLSYLCHFNERNPWDGIYKGRANHLLDVAYMWGNYNQKYTNQNWTVARALAEDMVRFTAGKGSLPSFNKEGNVVTIYGPSDDNISSKHSTLGAEDTGRNHAFFRLADEVGGLDACLDAMVRFLQG
ncbi:unnamed protein product [Clonostachys byssicola]|uniref:Carboxylesterase type B domain-containing protein n=1 Tax=Clonostachys byssicola TaxID=160290 RepID=A0A9N9U350_9HYPO|nr:unnamed protein product [Clonostachys byssicola]